MAFDYANFDDRSNSGYSDLTFASLALHSQLVRPGDESIQFGAANPGTLISADPDLLGTVVAVGDDLRSLELKNSTSAMRVCCITTCRQASSDG